jgi:hydrogenase nickel incorporation protein HypA/HybF
MTVEDLQTVHELSVALSILDVAAEEARRLGAARVLAVHLRLGELSGVAADPLRLAFELAREDSALPEAELVIEAVPVRVNCPSCRAERPVESVHALCCAACGTFTADVVAGRELEIAALEVQ